MNLTNKMLEVLKSNIVTNIKEEVNENFEKYKEGKEYGGLMSEFEIDIKGIVSELKECNGEFEKTNIEIEGLWNNVVEKEKGLCKLRDEVKENFKFQFPIPSTRIFYSYSSTPIIPTLKMIDVDDVVEEMRKNWIRGKSKVIDNYNYVNSYKFDRDIESRIVLQNIGKGFDLEKLIENLKKELL